jgi:hypothetical protein
MAAPEAHAHKDDSKKRGGGEEEKAAGKGILGGAAGRYVRAVRIKDRAQSVKEKVAGEVAVAVARSQDYLEYIGTVKELTEDQLRDIKTEIRDLKRIFRARDPVYFKTEALAVVIRRFGKTDEFMAAIDGLTREGYLLVQHEIVRNIPLGGGMSFPIGSFYYFQHTRYIGNPKTAPGHLHNNNGT